MKIFARCPKCNKRIPWTVDDHGVTTRKHSCPNGQPWRVTISVERDASGAVTKIPLVWTPQKNTSRTAGEAGVLFTAKHAAVYDAEAQGVSAEEGKYLVVCEHGNLVMDTNLVQAKQSARWPWNFCEECHKYAEGEP